MYNRLEYVKVFLDNTRVIEKITFKKYIEKLNVVLTWIEEEGLQINLSKSKWKVNKAKYLGYIKTKEEYSPDPKRIQGLV